MNSEVVVIPIIGQKYHIRWAKSFAMVWQLKSISGNSATLITKRGKEVTCKISDLIDINKNANKMKNENTDKQPWSFCETPEENCTMNFCDENGCQNRERCLVDGAQEDISGLPTSNIHQESEVTNG